MTIVYHGSKEKEPTNEDPTEGKRPGDTSSYGELVDQWKSDDVCVRQSLEDCTEAAQKLVYDSGLFSE